MSVNDLLAYGLLDYNYIIVAKVIVGHKTSNVISEWSRRKGGREGEGGRRGKKGREREGGACVLHDTS